MSTEQEAIKRLLKKDLLGKLPLFYALTNLDISPPPNNKQYVRKISVPKYGTTEYTTNGYAKPISKIV